MIKSTVETIIHAHRHRLDLVNNDDVNELACLIRDAVYDEVKHSFLNVLEDRCYGIPG